MAGTSAMFSSQATLQTEACSCPRRFLQSPSPHSDPGALCPTGSLCVKCVHSSSLSSSSRNVIWKVTQMLLLLLIPNASLKRLRFVPDLVSSALSRFSVPDAVKMVPLKGSLSILELFHGKTLAFKDLAMTCTTQFLEYFLRKDNRRAIILVGKQKYSPSLFLSHTTSQVLMSSSALWTCLICPAALLLVGFLITWIFLTATKDEATCTG